MLDALRVPPPAGRKAKEKNDGEPQTLSEMERKISERVHRVPKFQLEVIPTLCVIAAVVLFIYTSFPSVWRRPIMFLDGLLSERGAGNDETVIEDL